MRPPAADVLPPPARPRASSPQSLIPQWIHRDLHSDFRRAEPASSCWTMSPSIKGGSGETRTHNPREADTCFRDRLPGTDRRLVAAGSLPFATIESVPGVGIEPTASCFRDRYRVPAATIPEQAQESRQILERRVRGEGVEPPSPGSKPGSLPLADPRATENRDDGVRSPTRSEFRNCVPCL